MAENARPPVAVRIVRPYETEEAFLENELETVGKTSVILIGAHSRPTGVILRFEVTLASGATVLRGEGRVLAHKESAFRGQPGLALRFTRLDPKSKALVDRAAAIREARLAGDAARVVAPPPPSSSAPAISSPPEVSASVRPAARSVRPSAPVPSHGSMPPDAGLAQMLTSPTPPPPALNETSDDEERSYRSASRAPSSVPPHRSERPAGAPSIPVGAEDDARSGTLVDEAEAEAESRDAVEEGATAESASSDVATSDTPPRPQAITSLPLPPTPSVPPSAPPPEAGGAADARGEDARAMSRPADRDSLLSRLRQRAASLTEEQMAAILRRPS